MQKNSIFQTEQVGDTVIVTPTKNMGEFEMSSMEGCQTPAYDQLVQLTRGYNVVIDLSCTDYFGSSTIGLFNRLVTHVQKNARRIAFCNPSAHEREVISITHMNKLWDVKTSRAEALTAVSTPNTINEE